MSLAYTSTSFGAQPPSSQTQSSAARHQRHPSTSSGSTAVTANITPRDNELPGLPPPATAHTPTRPSHSHSVMQAQYDQIGAFFGGGRPSNPGRSSPSRHSERGSTTSGGPPSYDSRSEIESLPTYSKIEEYDAVLSRKLFKFGFLFFPFWILGIVAPFVTPNQDIAKDNRTKEDQKADYTNMRKAEIRWAWRCAVALLGFITLVVIAVVVGVTVANNKN